MNHPRERFERLFDDFNECFERTAKREGFVFDKEPGHVRRSLRLKNDSLKRGVFLELRESVLEADPTNPKVMLAYGAWFYPQPHHYPFHYLRKVFYEGGLSGLRESVEKMLDGAAIEIKQVTEEIVVRDGKLIENPKKDGGESLKSLG